MKIGIVTYSLNAGGGVSTFVLSLGKYLSSQGHDVTIVTEQSQGEWFPQIARSGLKSRHRNIGGIEWLPFGKFIYSRIVGKLLDREQFDAIILNHARFAQLAAHKFNKRSVVLSVIHNDNRGVYLTDSRNSRNVDGIACVSAATYNGAHRYIDGRKLHCIPNGIELPGNDIDTLSRNGSQTIKIIFVGRLNHEQKGICFIPQILALCRQKATFPFHLTIVGNGAGKNTLEKLLKENRVDNLVTFTGTIPREEVYRLYASHHIFLMPSFYEGLPLTLIESMSCGCVPVASRLDNITDKCVDDAVSGYLPRVGDVQAFAEAILKLAGNRGDLAKMSELCAQKAAAGFSVQRMGNDYLRLIHTLQEKRRSGEYRPDGFKLRNFHWKDFFPDKLIMEVKNRFFK
jgi:glycosyltransferase involved in cell wall biosynthesis